MYIYIIIYIVLRKTVVVDFVVVVVVVSYLCELGPDVRITLRNPPFFGELSSMPWLTTVEGR